MATFGSTTFIESGAETPSYSSRVQGRIIRIPGGDQTIVQRNPTSVHTLDTEAECTGAQVASLRAQVGSFGQLALGATTATALLLGVEPRRVFKTDTYIVGLSFKILRGFGAGQYGVNYGD